MELVENIKMGIKHTVFNEKAIKSVILDDDILYLNYTTKQGTPAEIMFPNVEDADIFLCNTLAGYRQGQFTGDILGNFLENVAYCLKAKIKKAHTGFGRLSNLSFGRFMMAQAIENLTRNFCSQNKSSSAAIHEATVYNGKKRPPHERPSHSRREKKAEG